MMCVEDHLIRPRLRTIGCPLARPVCLARSFLAMMALNLPTTSWARRTFFPVSCFGLRLAGPGHVVCRVHPRFLGVQGIF